MKKATKKVITFKGQKYIVTDGQLKLQSGEVTPRNITERYVNYTLRKLMLVRFSISIYWDKTYGNTYSAGEMRLYFKDNTIHTIGKGFPYGNADSLRSELIRNYAKERLNGLSLSEYSLQKLIGSDFVICNKVDEKYRDIIKIKYDGKVSITTRKNH